MSELEKLILKNFNKQKRKLSKEMNQIKTLSEFIITGVFAEKSAILYSVKFDNVNKIFVELNYLEQIKGETDLKTIKL
jgi:hypothetical protein